MHGFDDAGRLKRLQVAPGGATVAERPRDMAFESGGQGLWSTVDDYLGLRAGVRRWRRGGRRAAAQAGDPGPDGPRTVLSERQRAEARMLGMRTFAAGNGFGLGVAVVIDPQTASMLRGKGGVGTVAWPGAYGGWWQADSGRQLGDDHPAAQHGRPRADGAGLRLGRGYGAIEQFHALGSALKA
jgi:hypothetical protein